MKCQIRVELSLAFLNTQFTGDNPYRTFHLYKDNENLRKTEWLYRYERLWCEENIRNTSCAARKPLRSVHSMSGTPSRRFLIYYV